MPVSIRSLERVIETQVLWHLHAVGNGTYVSITARNCAVRYAEFVIIKDLLCGPHSYRCHHPLIYGGP